MDTTLLKKNNSTTGTFYFANPGQSEIQKDNKKKN
jgi:hypothetical protein